MGSTGLVPKIKDGDWVSVRQAIAKLSTKLGPASHPTYAGLTLTGLTASRLIATDADKALESSDLYSWVTGTANQVIVTDDADGTITLSTPQNIHAAATPTFAGLTLTNACVIGSDSVIFQPNTDSTTFFQVLDADGGTPILNVDSTNERIGIGTNAPDSILHIKANTPGTVGSHPAGQLIIQDPDDTVFGNAVITGYESDGAGNPDQQLWYLGSSSSSNSDIIYLNRRNSKLHLGTNGIVRMTIESGASSGYIGIGELSPETLTEWTSTIPYLTLHNSTHEDTDGGGESKLIFKREDGAGTETTCFQFEASHDGAVANDQLGKGIWSVNTGAGLVQALEIGSDLLATFAGSVVAPSAVIGSVAIPGVYDVQKEPTGFADKVATLSWDDVTYTLTITGSHDIYIHGVKTTKGTDSIQITDATDLYWIYYNAAGTLTASTTHPGFDLPLMASVYWNTTTDKGLAGEERHGIVMDWSTHKYLHETVGSRYESGLAGTFDNTTITIETGEWHDEDIQHTPAQQTICNVLYKNGSAAWEWDAGVSVYYKLNGANLRYNSGNNLADAGANQYMAMWIFITNDISTPIIALMGQRVDTTIANARANNTYESLSLGELPFQEMKLLYRVILRNTGTPPTWTETADYRSVSNVPSGTYIATAHSTLTGLSADDHTQYALLAGRVGGQTLYGSDTTAEDLTLGDNSVDDNKITVTQAIAAYTHSQLTSGNPHVVTPTELSLVIGTDVQAHGAVLDDLNTLGINAADSEFLVGTGAGALAWESGATVRTSIGLGTGNSPTFTGLTLSSPIVFTTTSGIRQNTSDASDDQSTYLAGGGAFGNTRGACIICYGNEIGEAPGKLYLYGGNVANGDIILNVENVERGRFTAEGLVLKSGALFIQEQAAAEANIAAYGQLWVKTATPNQLWFTDDTGTDVQLGTQDGKVKIDTAATAGYFGVASSDGVLRTGTGLTYADGGNFVTLTSVPLAGTVVQVVNVMDGAVNTGTVVIPIDDTIPQNDEGDQYMSLAITPTSATNKLKIDVVLQMSNSFNGIMTHMVALFQDDIGDALAAVYTSIPGQYYGSLQKFTHYMVAGTVSETTFKVRAGGQYTGTTTFNGAVSARLLGGLMASSITITEIEV